MRPNASSAAAVAQEVRPHGIFRRLGVMGWTALFLAAVAFLVYWPSLKSDFVYDALVEIKEEGFVTSFSRLPEVLSLQVLGMHLMLASRPGHLLYLMLIASICGDQPFGYHLCSNLLHAANVALLFVLLVRLVKAEWTEMAAESLRKVQLTAAGASLIFAVHPLAAETVADVSYSSDLLVAFFTLLTLLAATAFDPANPRRARLPGCAGTLCALAAVCCKESGLAAAGLLVVYWFLFRRREAMAPWLCFLGGAIMVTAAFLTARFVFAAPADSPPLAYLGGAFSRVFLIQPRLWVFMMGKLVWPFALSADYTPENIQGTTTAIALIVLAGVVGLQGWLAMRSRLGALGVATYWLGLATVSNFIPLYRIVGDRFYYLPMAGVVMQLVAVLLMLYSFRRGLWAAAMVCGLAVIVPLTMLTVARENIFTNQFVFWSETIKVSPFSSNAHSGLGYALFERGEVDAAIAEYREALKINPSYAECYNNLGFGLFVKGRVDDAIAFYRKALQLQPNLVAAHNNLGNALVQKNEMPEAIGELEWAIELNPNVADIRYNLGNLFLKEERKDEALTQFQKAVEIYPEDFEARTNLGLTLSEEGDVDGAIAELQAAVKIAPGYAPAHFDLASLLAQRGALGNAIAEFEEALKIDPTLAEAHYDLGNAWVRKGELDAAIVEFQTAVKINPNFIVAHANLALALSQKGRMDEALAQFREVLRLAPNDANAQKNLAKMEALAKKGGGSK
jgi:tetratricopeptide (TPR) repeat protein